MIETIAGIEARIAAAIGSAFPTLRKLDLFVRFYLNEDLFTEISGRSSVRNVAARLVEWLARNKSLMPLSTSHL